MITFKPITWHVKTFHDEDANRRTAIDVFGLDRESKPQFVRMVNFPVNCYLQLPSKIGNNYISWTEELAQGVFDYLKGRESPGCKPIEYIYEPKPVLFYRREQEVFPMIKLFFYNEYEMKNCANKTKTVNISGSVIPVEFWETDIPLITKLQAKTETNHTGWFTINATKSHNKVTKLANEFITEDWMSMKLVPDNECAKWAVNPKVMSFDIETYSNNHRALPNASKISNVIYLISANTGRIGVDGVDEYAVFIYGDCNKPQKENAKIFRYQDAPGRPGSGEIAMLYDFGNYINSIDPDIITGYNINSYDFNYIERRLSRIGLSWIYCGRYLTEAPIPIGYNRGTLKGDTEGFIQDISGMYYKIAKPYYCDREWSSSGRGKNYLRYYVMDGRCNIDLLPVIRGYYQLDRYTLDFVSKRFLDGEGKNPITPQEMFEIYERSFQKTEQSIADMTRVVDYCIQDSDLVLRLINKMDIWITIDNMSYIVGVSIEDTYMHGQQPRCVALIYKTAYAKGIVVDRQVDDCKGYSGGAVDQPVPGFYQQALCFDFASLYPSLMIRYKLCYRSYIPPQYRHLYNPDDCWIFKFTQEEADEPEADKFDVFSNGKPKRKNKNAVKHIVEHEYWFDKNAKTLLPEIQQSLIARRNEARKMGETFPESSPEYLIYFKRQIALKITANSLYGFVGVNPNAGGRLPCFPIARSITYLGRHNKELLGTFIAEQFGGKIVYGDTDSVIGETPIPLNINGSFCYLPIYMLADIARTLRCPLLRPGIYDIRELGWKVWSEGGWTLIIYVKEHTVTKQLFNVFTEHGHVIVTEDHSLLRSDGQILKPTDIRSGTHLLHSNPVFGSDIELSPSSIDVFASLILFAKTIEDKVVVTIPNYINFSQIARSYLSYFGELAVGGLMTFSSNIITFFDTKWYEEVFMFQQRKRFPNILYNITPGSARTFIDRYRQFSNQPGSSVPLSCTLLDQSSLYAICKKFNPLTTFSYSVQGWAINHHSRKAFSQLILNTVPLGVCTETVYDIETESSHFAVGPGELIVHNSCMVKLEQITENSQCQYWGELIAQAVSGYEKGDPLPGYGYRIKQFPDMVHQEGKLGIFQKPMKIEYEKGMDMLSLCKKHYAYLVILPDGSYKKNDKTGDIVIENKGVVTAKRGIAKILTNYYRRCLHSILTVNPMEKTLTIIAEMIQRLMKKEFDITEIEQIASVADSYQSASNSLATFSRLMAEAGNPIVAGEKFGYVVVKGKSTGKEKEKKGFRMRLFDKYLLNKIEFEKNYDQHLQDYYVKLTEFSQLLDNYRPYLQRLSSLPLRPPSPIPVYVDSKEKYLNGHYEALKQDEKYLRAMYSSSPLFSSHLGELPEVKVSTLQNYLDQILEPLDIEYYVLNVIAHPISSLFYVAYKNEIDKLYVVSYKPPTLEHRTFMNQIVLTLYRWFLHGNTFEQFLQLLENGREYIKRPLPELIVIQDPYEALANVEEGKKRFDKGKAKKCAPLYRPITCPQTQYDFQTLNKCLTPRTIAKMPILNSTPYC